jgi:hypothetical protein
MDVPVWAATGLLSRSCPYCVAPPRLGDVCPQLVSRLQFPLTAPVGWHLELCPDGWRHCVSLMDGPGLMCLHTSCVPGWLCPRSAVPVVWLLLVGPPLAVVAWWLLRLVGPILRWLFLLCVPAGWSLAGSEH